MNYEEQYILITQFVNMAEVCTQSAIGLTCVVYNNYTDSMGSITDKAIL